MAKKKQKTLGQQMYAKEIKRIKNYISKKEKEGYNFADKDSLIPQMPKRVTRQAIDRVSNITAKELLEKSTKAVYNPETEETIVTTGTEAKRIQSTKAYKNYIKTKEQFYNEIEEIEEVADKYGGLWNGEMYEGNGWVWDIVSKTDYWESLRKAGQIKTWSESLQKPSSDSSQEIEAKKEKDFAQDVADMINEVNAPDYHQDRWETPEERFYRYQEYSPKEEPVNFVDTVLAEVEEMIDTYESYVESNSNWGDFFKEEKLRYNSTLRNILNGAINLFGRKQIAENCEANAQRLIEIVNEILYGSG